MKLYDFVLAPNPRKVRLYIAEKGIAIATQAVDIMQGENRESAYLQINPWGQVPALQLDDGSTITQSLAIIEYLEELYPNPNMIGETPEQRAQVRAMERLIDSSLLNRVATVFQHSHPIFSQRIQQSSQRADEARQQLAGLVQQLDNQYGAGEFLMGDKVSIADCSLFATHAMAEFAGFDLFAGAEQLTAWQQRFNQRDSVALSLK